MKWICTLLLLAFFQALSSCVSNKEEDIPKPNTCDTLTMSYAEDIASLFENNECLDCHSTQTATAGIILDNYQSVVNNADKIYPAISWPAGFPPGKQMPIGAPKVSQCEIDQFAAWLHQGKQP
jgi:cytochrome c551/c552